jgi:hypothetical protein
MSDGKFDPNSTDAAISRIEAKLDNALQRLDKHGNAIDRLWQAVGSSNVKVASIAGGVSVCAFVVEYFLKK